VFWATGPAGGAEARGQRENLPIALQTNTYNRQRSN
jgi:hypothetical protein